MTLSATEAEDEIETLESEIRRALGLGGRKRLANSDSERARLSVTQAIKGAVTKIGENYPALGAIVARDIKTGTYCSYDPRGLSSIEWEFGPLLPYYAIEGTGTSPNTRDIDRESVSLEANRQDMAEPLGLSLSQRKELIGHEAERPR